MSRLAPDGIGLLTTAEAAHQLGVSRGTVRSWVTRYGLTRVAWEGHRYFVEREVLELDRRLRSSQRSRPRQATRR